MRCTMYLEALNGSLSVKDHVLRPPPSQRGLREELTETLPEEHEVTV